MSLPAGPGPLQSLRFRRSRRGFRGVPFHGLMECGFGDPGRPVAAADLVLAVDVMTGQLTVVYGEVALFPTEFAGRRPGPSARGDTMSRTSDRFADLAEWLGRPVGIPVRGEDRGPTPEHAQAAAQHLLAVDTIPDGASIATPRRPRSRWQTASGSWPWPSASGRRNTPSIPDRHPAPSPEAAGSPAAPIAF
jgi:hypothetical protein